MNNSSNYSILLVDDDSHVIEGLVLLFEDDYKIQIATSGLEAIEIVKDDPSIAVVVMDIKMPGMNGIESARQIRILRPNIPVIFHTGFPGQYSEDEIDQTEKPFDYIQKGSAISKLTRSVKNAFNAFLLEIKAEGVNLQNSDWGLIGNSQCMKEIFSTIDKVSGSDTKVIILGETGTGKELVAKAIHKNSSRSNQKLVIFNCNHKSADLVESELFGHSKGAFTGAITDRVGLFEYADGGTVFLDEIGDLDITTQAKLLRVLETGEFQSIGETQILKTTNIRLMCATHHCLETLVSEGKFRQDLYYRLKGVTIVMPPLRDRKEDIPLLVTRHVQSLTVEKDLMPKHFDRSAIEKLMQNDWPGNVRQLLDTVESLMVLTNSDIIMDIDVSNYFGNEDVQRSNALSLSDRTIEFRKNLIVSVLHDTNGNISAAARILEIDQANLRKLIKSYDIQ